MPFFKIDAQTTSNLDHRIHFSYFPTFPRRINYLGILNLRTVLNLQRWSVDLRIIVVVTKISTSVKLFSI